MAGIGAHILKDTEESRLAGGWWFVRYQLGLQLKEYKHTNAAEQSPRWKLDTRTSTSANARGWFN